MPALAFVCAVAILCLVLAILQYRWIATVSEAERDRLRADLDRQIKLLTDEFNTRLNALRGLVPQPSEIDSLGVETAYLRRWQRFDKKSFVKRAAVAIRVDDRLELHRLDSSFKLFDWPEDWSDLREQMIARLSDRGGGSMTENEPSLIEYPRFGKDGREHEWLVIEISIEYTRNVLLPELIRQRFGSAPEFDLQIVFEKGPSLVLFGAGRDRMPDASGRLFEVQYGGPPGPHAGRWVLNAWRTAGPLDDVVNRAKYLNLTVSTTIFLMISAAAWALLQYTRKAYRLADVQMNFVAGISHELRTPLSVIATAAYNLRGRVAQNPAQVEKYGALIQDEADKLTGIVEQVLLYAGSKAGHVIRQREPVLLDAIIAESVQSSRTLFDKANCVVETRIEDHLPVILGDAMALRQVIKNLINNAVKYGTEGGNWVGIFASSNEDRSQVEVRVADRGPGIPLQEQEHIFDAFYRGRQAIADQIHGTGLGLNLVKQIIEAHEGTISVRSDPGHGAEFVIRIPAAAPQYQDEFSHTFG